MPDPSLSEAMKEAYASAPAGEVILHTISLYHPDWRDGKGNAVTLYFVRDYADHTLTIESDAERDAGEAKLFQGVAFEFTLPDVKTSSVAEISVKIDNVDGELMPYLDTASASKDKVTVTYRPYLSSDTTQPQMNPPLELTLTTISVDTFQMIGKASMSDSGGRAFPNAVYTLANFPALANF